MRTGVLAIVFISVLLPSLAQAQGKSKSCDRCPYGMNSGWSTYEQGMSDQIQSIR